MPTEWTPERRAQQSAKMKESHAARRNTATAVGGAGADLPLPVNPPTTDDVVPESAPTPPPSRARRSSISSKPIDNIAFDIGPLVADIAALPLDAVSYADCGLLLNALSAASTLIATARRQKQESLDAGTHRAPCATCGRPIDISKSGGFQILTERDEHFQPRNVYYCSQNCLLAKNMPSHRPKRSPGDAGART